ncbi:dihydrofolate reductase family protein [Demequina pelophila]|uniref:dihydrofolate reductase family protein n=1 Tax=Demequina pelophila TaxID=1638984 RepID=UPI000782019D|nr:dihydrofolate reductase family protein [Demequina pelophila]
MGLVRAYLAMSLDGFVAGEDDDLGWLEPRASGTPIAGGAWAGALPDGLHFEDFLDDVGAILMGRRTWDIVAGFDEWPYRDVPLVVASHRPVTSSRPSVRGDSGPLEALVARCRALAGERDVYVDGATLVREALAAGLLDHLVVTMMPTALGRGVPLFAGLDGPRELTVERVESYGEGLVQIHLAVPGARA